MTDMIRGMIRIACSLLSILVLAASTAPAQSGAQASRFGAGAMAGPSDVLLLIGGDMLHPSSASRTQGWIGYHVYRKGPGDPDFRRMTTVPVSRVSSPAELSSRLGVRVDFLVNMLGLDGAPDLWRLVEQSDRKLLSLAVFDPDIREAFGLLWRDRAVTRGGRYEYQITRVDASGRESERSAVTTVTAGVPMQALRGPLSPTARSDGRSVRVEWQANPADSGGWAYAVYRSAERGGGYLRLNDRPILLFTQSTVAAAPSGSLIDTTVEAGRTYYYAVVSLDYAGNESAKEPLIEVAVRDTAPPAIPQGLIARGSGLGIALTWFRNIDDDLAGYNVYRSTHLDTGFVLINDALVPPDSGWYEDRDAGPGQQFYYRVTSVDREGNESIRSARAMAAYNNFRPPLPPQGVQADMRADGVLLRWDANEEEDLIGYVVYRAEKFNGDLVQVSPQISKDTVQYHDRDAHLSPKGSYWYLVQAVNLAGAVSSFSAPVVASPGGERGPEPTTTFRGWQDASGNRLFWTESADNTVSGYYVERRAARETAWSRVTRAPLPSSAVSYTDAAAAAGVEYRYRLVPVSSGGREGAPSHEVALTRFEAAPLPPAGVMVTQSGRSAEVQWDPSLDRRVTGYHVYRKDGKGDLRRLSSTPVPSGRPAYTDTSAPRGTRCMYVVTAIAADGRESLQSDPVWVRFD